MHEFGHGLYERGVCRRSNERRLPRLLVGPARVAEPALGEHRRPLPPFWRYFYPRSRRRSPRPSRTSARSVPPLDQPGASRRSSASTPTRPRTGCTSSCASSSNRRSSPARSTRKTCRRRGTPASRSTWASRCRGPARRPAGRALVAGGFGYFPTYQSATSCPCRSGRSGSRAALPARAVRAGRVRQVPRLAAQPLYSLGRKFTPQETLERVVGGPIDAAPYIRYLKEKLGALAAA